MVAALGLGKFYGSSLPRPRFYTDVKLSDERIDPPLPVMDPLMAWAEEAHWTMGGSCTTRRRLQGRIEGNVNKLRVQREAVFKKSANPKSISSSAPKMIKRRRVIGLWDEEEEAEGRGIGRAATMKLGENLEKVAGENNGGGEGGLVVAARKKSERKETESSKVKAKAAEGRRRSRAAAVAGIRNSPRLAMIGRPR